MNVNDCIQTLLNPKDMFLTLGNNIVPCYKKNKEIDFWIENRIVYFRVRINGVKHIIWCFLGDRQKARQHFKTLSLHLKKLKNKHFLKWKFLHDEMLMLDNYNKFVRVDIVVQKELKTQSVSEFLASSKVDQNPALIQKLTKSLIEMSDDFYDNGLNFNGIDFKGLQVKNDLSAIISISNTVNIVSCDEHENYEQLFVDDTKNFATFICLLTLLTLEPSYFISMGSYGLLNVQNLRNLLPQIHNFALKIGLKELADLTLCNSNHNRAKIKELSTALAHKDFTELRERVAELNFDNIFTVSCVSEFALRVDNGCYYYIHIHTHERVFDQDFDYGEEFVMGRTVVSVNSKFGLLDTLGNFNLDPVFDDITWYGKYNLAVAHKDDNYYLYKGNGQRIGELVFSFVGELSEELLIAKLGKYYGYINTRGEFTADSQQNDLPVEVPDYLKVKRDKVNTLKKPKTSPHQTEQTPSLHQT